MSKMDPMSKTVSKTLVWQVCQCEVTDTREYCVTCFPSKSCHLIEAMRDEDTFLRFPDLRVHSRLYTHSHLNKKVLEPGIKS